MRKKWESFVKWIKEYGNYLVLIIFVVIVVVDVFIAYFSTFGFTLGDDKGDWGTFGDFIGGTLNPILSFFGFIALLYTVKMQRKQLDDTDKFQAKQQFESTFFELLKMHNEILDKFDPEKISSRIFNHHNTENCGGNLTHIARNYKLCEEDKFPTFCFARKMLEKELMCQHYFRVLYQLFKFIAINTPDSNVSSSFTIEELEKNATNFEKTYSNIVRALLPDGLIKLVVAYAYCEKGIGDESYYKFRLLIERYAFFQNHLFETTDENSILFRSWDFYNEKAFGTIERPLKSSQNQENP